MSYWFPSFLRSTATAENDEAEEGGNEPQPGTSTNSSEERSTTSMLREFPEDQRRHIRDVLERAEKSKTQAKVVVNSDVLQHVRYRQQQRGSESERSFDAEDEEEEELLQMESMDDTMEVTLGGAGRDYSPFVTSEMSLGDSNLDDRCYTPSISIDVPMDPTPEPNIVSRGVKLLSQKIMEWVKSLDEEDGYVSQPKVNPLEKTDEEGFFYEGSLLDDYCSHLARNLCILAIADYLTDKKVRRVRDYESMVDFAQRLTELILSSALGEIRTRSSGRSHLARRFSRFVSETIEWAVREAVIKQQQAIDQQKEEEEKPSTSRRPQIVISEDRSPPVDVAQRAAEAHEEIIDNIANELASEALHRVVTELQYNDESNPTGLFADASYTILNEGESRASSSIRSFHHFDARSDDHRRRGGGGGLRSERHERLQHSE
ncbi:hypothetical protein M3Y99_01590900 [Aphelenchoides fujianensis]|nr:hypothetical protein M3Y99_01590900 [Aphelenchoides fujianensis]